MNTTHDTTAMLKEAMTALPIDTSAAEGAFKSSAALNEKISAVALTASEKSVAISQQWTQQSLKSLSDVSKAKSEPTDYVQAMTDFTAELSKAATEHMTAFAENAKEAQTDTLELLMAASKNFGEHATSAAKAAGKDVASGAKTIATK
ncbi:phasin, PhaP [Yoonia algicola]|uniref:Phasin, PhaP n=2 Tax=Yoonia algicola TaxID=3137368 RepID=A0AAN0M3N9_9RHOB